MCGSWRTCIERALIFAGPPLIEAADLQLKGGRAPAGPEPPGRVSRLKEIEKRSIAAALHRWEGNRTRAAEELGISRRSLLYKIKEYGIDIPG